MTRKEIAEAIGETLDRQRDGEESLWATATKLADQALRLEYYDKAASDRLKVLTTQMAAYGVAEVSGQPRSDLIEETMASVRLIAGRIGENRS